MGLDDDQHLMLLKESIKPLSVLEPCQQRKSQRELVLGVHPLAVRVLAEGRRPENHFFEPVSVLDEPGQGIVVHVQLVIPGQTRADHLVLSDCVLVHVVRHEERGLADQVAAVQGAAALADFHVLELGAVVEIDIELSLGRVQPGKGPVARDGRFRPVDPDVQFHLIDGIRRIPGDKRHVFDLDVFKLLGIIHYPCQLVLAVEPFLQKELIQRVSIAGHVRVALQHDLVVHGEQGRRRVGDEPLEFYEFSFYSIVHNYTVCRSSMCTSRVGMRKAFMLICGAYRIGLRTASRKTPAVIMPTRQRNSSAMYNLIIA